MLTGPRFSLCAVRDALEAAGLDAPRESLAALRLHHCAPFAEMPPGFHAELAAATLALFDAQPTLDDGLLYDLARAAGLSPDGVPALPTATA